jgi:predicted SAM-dependent methyltransferase
MVFSEHVLEHLDYPDSARVFLAEAFRILRDDGVLRIIVPDAGRAAEAYVRGDMDVLSRLAPGETTPIEALNKFFREFGFHRYAWDYPLLERELRDAGFVEVRRAEFRDSLLPELNIDFDDPDRRLQSLYVEAAKTLTRS